MCSESIFMQVHKDCYKYWLILKCSSMSPYTNSENIFLRGISIQRPPSLRTATASRAHPVYTPSLRTYLRTQHWACTSTILALVVEVEWHLHQMDMNNAFLQGELEEVVYMVQSPDFKSSSYLHVVYQLKKPLYNLKQVPWALHTKIV